MTYIKVLCICYSESICTCLFIYTIMSCSFILCRIVTLNIKLLKRTFLFLILTLFLAGSCAFAEEEAVTKEEAATKEETVDTEVAVPIDDLDLNIYTVQRKVKVNDNKAIKNTLKRLDKYVDDKNLNGISSIISDTFINNDGFTKEAYLKMLQKSWEMYPDLKGYSKIEKIEIDGNNAQVYVKDYSKSKMSNPANKLELDGVIDITTESILFMQKIGEEWKLQSIYTIKEHSVLAYSDAKDLKIKISAPNQVLADTPYCAKLLLESKDNYISFASISNDKIEYPQAAPEMVFKAPADDGLLERILHANTDGKNEYVVATIGITKPAISKDNKIVIKITGMAVAITRVNIINQKQDITKI